MTDATKEHLAALLRQEVHYQCADYLYTAGEEPSSKHTLVHMLEEFANVVTDQNFYYRERSATIASPRSLVTKSSSASSLSDVQQVDKMTRRAQKRAESFRFWRQQMFDWASMVCDSFSMDREVVAISFNLLDRYVAQEMQRTSQEITRDDFQLFSMTCLYLAVKLLEPYPRKIGVEALVEMSRGFYTADDIAMTERDILKQLQWYVNPPTASAYARLYWDLFPGPLSSAVSVTTVTLVEIAVADSFFVGQADSLVGLASVLIAARLHGMEDHRVQAFLNNIEGLIDIKQNVHFANIYRQLEILYCQ